MTKNDKIRTMFDNMGCHQSNSIIDAIANLYSIFVPKRIAARIYLKAVCMQYELTINDLIEWYKNF